VLRSPAATVTVNVVEAVLTSSALSVACAERVWSPAPNEHAGPDAAGHVDEAKPESGSSAVQMIETASRMP
jgi:hypothetical protein